MTRADLDIASEWARREGWNPGISDADCFYPADQDGFLMGFLGDEPVACISVVRYGPQFGFLGFYIVKPEHRGKGYGLNIWNAGMQFLKRRTVGLDGVLQQQENYRKSGYTLAYRNIRYVARAQCYGVVAGIVDAATVPFEDIMALDAEVFPARREVFMRRWIQQPTGRALALVDKDAGGSLQAFGAIRRAHTGYKIGPLYAANLQQADALYRALVSSADSGAEVFLDTPECNPAALLLASKYSMTKVFETVRMYSGPAPDLNLDKVFGVCTFELG